MEKQVIHTDKAPAAIGPYSQAVKAGGMLYCSGQIALKPETGELVEGSLADETKQVLANLGAVLEAGGSDFSKLVKVGIFLSDMAFFAEVNALYAECFTSDPPARATVSVAGLPKGVRVEIDGIAIAI